MRVFIFKAAELNASIVDGELSIELPEMQIEPLFPSSKWQELRAAGFTTNEIDSACGAAYEALENASMLKALKRAML